MVVMELALPDICGVQVTRKIMAAHPDTKILLMTTCIDENCFAKSLEAGAGGYLTKDGATTKALATAIRLVHQGKPYFCAEGQELLMKKCLPTHHQLSTTIQG